MNLKKLLGVATLASVFALTACNEEKKAEAAPAGKPAAEAPAKIKVGVMAGPEHEVAEIAANREKQDQRVGLNLLPETFAQIADAADFRAARAQKIGRAHV